MAKKLSIANFVITIVLVAVCLVFSFASFMMPNSSDRYNGFLNAIGLSQELGESQIATYKIEGDSTITCDVLNSLKQTANFAVGQAKMDFAKVSILNDNGLMIVTQKTDTAEHSLDAIADAQTITIRATQSTEKTEYDLVISGLKSCEATYSKTKEDSDYVYGLFLTFNNADAVKKLTKHASNNGNSLYFYNQDDELVGTHDGIMQTNSYGEIFFPNTEIQNETDLTSFAISVIMGTNITKLSIVDNFTGTATAGLNTYKIAYVAMGICVLLFAGLMIAKYKDLGLVSGLVTLINICLSLFIIQSLPILTLSIAGLIAYAVCFCFTYICQSMYFENIKKQLAEKKRMPLSFKLAFKETVMGVVDICVIMLISCGAMFFIVPVAIKSFAVILGVFGVSMLITTLVLTKTFAMWYLHINSTKTAKIGYKKEGGKNA